MLNEPHVFSMSGNYSFMLHCVCNTQFLELYNHVFLETVSDLEGSHGILECPWVSLSVLLLLRRETMTTATHTKEKKSNWGLAYSLRGPVRCHRGRTWRRVGRRGAGERVKSSAS